MLNLVKLAQTSLKPIYIHLSNYGVAQQFLVDAENQGFTFSDGEKPTKKHTSDFFVLHSDFSMNYIGAIGRMAYQCHSDNIICLDYPTKIS